MTISLKIKKSLKLLFSNLSDEIIKSLQRKKREPLIITKRLEISKKQYQTLKNSLTLNRKFQISQNIIDQFELKTTRYFEDGSSNQVISNSLKMKILKKNKQKFYERKNKILIQKQTKERFFFICKYQKIENTAFHNEDKD